VDDPVCELLGSREHLQDIFSALDRHDPPLGLREGGARGNVLDAPADSVLVRRGPAANKDPPEVLLTPRLLARRTHHPRDPGQQGMAHRVVAPPRPAREHRAAALAHRALPRATCSCLDGPHLGTSRAAAIVTPDEAFPLSHSTSPFRSVIVLSPSSSDARTSHWWALQATSSGRVADQQNTQSDQVPLWANFTQTIAPDTPVPRLLQGLIRSFVQNEAASAVRGFLDNVRRELEAG
jgi:hypothetical protein